MLYVAMTQATRALVVSRVVRRLGWGWGRLGGSHRRLASADLAKFGYFPSVSATS